MNFLRVLQEMLLVGLILSGCAPQAQPGSGGLRWPGGLEDSVIALRSEVPRDSVVMQRGEFSILLSAADIERALGAAPPGSEESTLRDELRRVILDFGWAEFGEGDTENYVAADLLQSGRAVIRSRVSNQLLPWVRLTMEREIIGSGATIVDYQVFTAPDNTVVLRVLSSTTIS
jgi:hypothetical protein